MINEFLGHTLVFFLVAALASAALTRIALSVLRRRAILDLPNERSSHTIPTPRGGGWGVMLTLLPFWLWAAWQARRLGDPVEPLLLLGAIALIAVSWIDDRRDLGPAVRLAVQGVAAGLVMAFLPRDLSISGGFLPLPLDRVVAALAWLWFINLFNFMDGIDGLAGGSAAAMGFGVMLVSLRHGPNQLEAFRGAMIAAVSVGFLVWNWQPAKIFMGDVGSIPLGYLLGYELVRLAMDGGQLFAAMIALYYLADATITLVKRARRGARIWEAHREHYYQRSTQLGRSHSRTAKTAILVQLALAIFAWLGVLWGWWLVAPSVILVALLLRWMSLPPRLEGKDKMARSLKIPAVVVATCLLTKLAAADVPAAPYALMSVKIAVADFQRSTDFYSQYFGMKAGALYNPAEKALDWPQPGQGSNIIMVHDASGHIKLTPGTALLMFRVPDARKIAGELTKAGYKGVGPVQEIKQYNTVVIMAEDPDGNQIEMMQVGPAK